MKLNRTLSLLALAAMPFIASAQFIASNTTRTNGSNGETPASQQWAREEDQVNGKLNKVRLSAMKVTTEAIVSYLHDSCISSFTSTPLWHGEYFTEKTSPGPQTKFSAICNFYDQKASLQVIANDISPLLDHIVVNNQDYLTIAPVTAIKNDCPYFEVTNEEGTKVSKFWLVTTAKDQLPYTPVSKKEYLVEARKELINAENAVNADMASKMPVRPKAVQDAEKKATIAQLNNMYSGIDLQIQLRMFEKNYQSDEDYLKENENKANANLDSTIHYMDTLLMKMPAAELNSPAFVSVAATDFMGFEDARTGKMMIKMNKAFFNEAPAGDKAHMFLVSLSYDKNETSAVALDKQISDKLDTQVLKSMLNK